MDPGNEHGVRKEGYQITKKLFIFRDIEILLG
jgi:hypothetical protein